MRAGWRWVVLIAVIAVLIGNEIAANEILPPSAKQPYIGESINVKCVSIVDSAKCPKSTLTFVYSDNALASQDIRDGKTARYVGSRAKRLPRPFIWPPLSVLDFGAEGKWAYIGRNHHFHVIRGCLAKISYNDLDCVERPINWRHRDVFEIYVRPELPSRCNLSPLFQRISGEGEPNRKICKNDGEQSEDRSAMVVKGFGDLPERDQGDVVVGAFLCLIFVFITVAYIAGDKR